jgi:hypothetical protein
MNAEDDLAEISRTIEAPTRNTLALRTLRLWMRNPDIEVQGATYALLRKAGSGLTVSPSPGPEEYLRFFKTYLERCLREDGHGPWSLTRHGAGWEIAAWVSSLFAEHGKPTALLVDLRGWLAALYRQGPRVERDAIVNAALEHLFERPSIREFFKEWETDPELATAYRDASRWAAHGGESPLVKTRKRGGGARRGPKRSK